MAKSIWKGEISFGLVAIPVSLVSTEESHTIHFHLLDSKSKSRVRYQRINEDTGKAVPWTDIVKGYEYDKGNYLIVDEKAFEKKSPDLFKTIEIDEFIDFKAYKVSNAEITLAINLIKEMAAKWEPEKYHNDYQQAMQQWLDHQILEMEKRIRNLAKNLRKTSNDKK